MKLIELLQEGITQDINDLKWSFINSGTHDYYKIIKILGELRINTLSSRSQKQIIHILTSYKEQLIRAILLKMRGDPSMIMSQTYLNEAVLKMIRLGLDWPELDTIQKSLDAELKRKLKESIDPNQSNEKIYNELADALKQQPNMLRISTHLLNLHRYNIPKNNPDLYADILKLLGESSQIILENLDSQMQRGWCADCITIIYMLKKFGFTAQWLIKWIENNKSSIIRYILEDVRDRKLTDSKRIIDDLYYIGITWSEFDIITNSIHHEFKIQKSKISEAIINNDNYGGWIDSKNKKIYYVNEYKHNAQALRFGADPINTNRWMFNHGYVRFVTQYSPHNSLAIEGNLSDIKATFNMWWPQARRCETLYVDDVYNHDSKTFYIKSKPEQRDQAQKLYGPQGFKLFEDFIDDHSYGGWINSKSKDAYYIDQEAPDHQELASILGSPEGGYDWMFNRGYVRFVTEDGHRTSLSLEGKLEDIKSIFKQWWPQARKVDDLYIDIINGESLHFNLSDDPASRIEAQKLFDPVNF